VSVNYGFSHDFRAEFDSMVDPSFMLLGLADKSDTNLIDVVMVSVSNEVLVVVVCLHVVHLHI